MSVEKTAKKIIDDLRKDNNEKVMFYLDKELHEQFKEFCADKKIRMSGVVERLIRNFMSEVKSKK